MRVSLVDPSAFTPPYDRSLAAALARAGHEVELLTSRFSYGPVPAVEGYAVREMFYRRSTRRAPGSRLRLPVKALEHPLDMLRLRAALAGTDVAHYQWLTLPALDRFLLPPSRGRPRLATLHYPLPPPSDSRGLRRQRRILNRFDAVISHTADGARRLRRDVGVDGDRVHQIPHGPLDYLTRLVNEEPLPDDLRGVEGPVILFFGLLRPYKGIDLLLQAFAEIEGAELWIAGMPRMPLEPLRALAAKAEGTVRFIPRFIRDPEIPALMRRAELLVLPYREIEQSGVLYTGLAFEKPMILSDVGGFGEISREQGVGALVPPGDVGALAVLLADLLADSAGRERLASACRGAVEGPYSWDAIAAATAALYERLGNDA